MITSVEARVLDLPVQLPLMDESTERSHVFTSVETEGSITGIGISGSPTPEATRDFVNNEIAPVIEGLDPVRTDEAWRTTAGELNPFHQTGVWSSAVSGVDIALWDAKGKHLGEPVWRLLGGMHDAVPVMVTFGHAHYSEDQLVTLAEQLVADGIDRLKMQVGREDPPDTGRDATRVAAVRDAIGDNVELSIDAKENLTLDRAVDLCERVSRYDIAFFEEPVLQNDPVLLSQLRDRTSIPIAAGQNEGSGDVFRRFIEHRSVDLLQPNVCYVGGFTAGRRIATTADAFNIPIANGGSRGFFNMHLQAGAANGSLVELNIHNWESFEGIFRGAPEPRDGHVHLTDRPGLGLEPDWDVIDGKTRPA